MSCSSLCSLCQCSVLEEAIVQPCSFIPAAVLVVSQVAGCDGRTEKFVVHWLCRLLYSGGWGVNLDFKQFVNLPCFFTLSAAETYKWIDKAFRLASWRVSRVINGCCVDGEPHIDGEHELCGDCCVNGGLRVVDRCCVDCECCVNGGCSPEGERERCLSKLAIVVQMVAAWLTSVAGMASVARMTRLAWMASASLVWISYRLLLEW